MENNAEPLENNDENRTRLAEEVVEGWDMDDLIFYAIKQLKEYYKGDDEAFEEEWIDHDLC